MSEWYDSQKNPSGDFRKLLQEILCYDSKLRMWFDRDVSCEIGEETLIAQENLSVTVNQEFALLIS